VNREHLKATLLAVRDEEVLAVFVHGYQCARCEPHIELSFLRNGRDTSLPIAEAMELGFVKEELKTSLILLTKTGEDRLQAMEETGC
jgi:hypothetical protein